MTFDPRSPITTANCPTRAALEKAPKVHTPIAGKCKKMNAAKKKVAHLANLQARAS